jgi:ATP-dependent protease ClpP protease subunit
MTICPVVSDSADFTPNPDRAIWITGEMTQELAEHLQPEILAFNSQSRQPITVFIDGGGGNVRSARRILRLLKSTKGGAACRVICVAERLAGSAGADLLSSGDHAIAHAGAKLLCHGTRLFVEKSKPITAEYAVLSADALQADDRRAARSLLRKLAPRLAFLIFTMRSMFEKHRAAVNDLGLTNLECFRAIQRTKLSPNGQNVLDRASTRSGSYSGLLREFWEQPKEAGAGDAKIKGLRTMILGARSAFQYRRQTHRQFFNIKSLNHFLFEYSLSANGGPIGKSCEERVRCFLSEAEDVRAYLLPFWPFFIALCRELQVGENWLTAMDALWLGLVDSVT